MNLTDPLSKKSCVPCQGSMAPLKGEILNALMKQLKEGWVLIKDHHIEKEFSFQNFRQALDFANKIGAVAESEGHHPEMLIGWGKVKISLWTHKIDGLTESDFILAAKSDECYP